jgi:hypothetical protein
MMCKKPKKIDIVSISHAKATFIIMKSFLQMDALNITKTSPRQVNIQSSLLLLHFIKEFL